MRLFIPPLKSKVRLLTDAVVPVMHESRNFTILKALGKTRAKDSWTIARWDDPPKFSDVPLPAGTVLSIDRYYIRNGSEEFDSLTFRIVSSPEPKLMKPKHRFWLKLADVNNLDATFEAEEKADDDS